MRIAKGAQTRARLLEAARMELTQGGGEMELAAVARRAGVSPGLPYRYFASKSALLVAVVESFFDQLDEAVYRPTFAEVSEDWWAREKARIERLVDFFYAQPLSPFIISQLAGDAAVIEAQHRRVTRQVRGASANLKTGKKLGRIPAHINEALCGAMLIGGVYQALNLALSKTPWMKKRKLITELQAFMRKVLQIEE